ncbi:MAG: hypothetical protein OEY19_01990 [Gammaproteobacteria bacterium]|nr:hypothetical protein [Gammaproteobacteria bacterium]MDH5628651.1 hypothetical protein [Gammaproteobacteria bacterium]
MKNSLNIIIAVLLTIHNSGISAAEKPANVLEEIVNSKEHEYDKALLLHDLLNSKPVNIPEAAILLALGQTASNLEISLQEFSVEQAISQDLHMKIVHSENFGDFVSYDGYHFQQIIKKHPKSDLVDDAEYELIYVLPDSHNYWDLKVEKKALEAFLKKHPKTNLLNEVTERIKFIADYLDSGGWEIVD